MVRVRQRSNEDDSYTDDLHTAMEMAGTSQKAYTLDMADLYSISDSEDTMVKIP
jgi:hypothetical protein